MLGAFCDSCNGRAKGYAFGVRRSISSARAIIDARAKKSGDMRLTRRSLALHGQGRPRCALKRNLNSAFTINIGEALIKQNNQFAFR
jgi:hypothetical protein